MNQVPRSYRSVDEFDKWLHDVYIPNTLGNFTECWGIFSADGQFEKYHHKTYYTILTPDLEKDLRGKIMSHNHPTDSTFSRDDVETLIAFGMKEMHVVTATCRFIIKPKNGDSRDKGKIAEEMDKLITEMEMEYFGIEDVPQIRHRCLRKMSENGWFDYSWEKFPLI